MQLQKQYEASITTPLGLVSIVFTDEALLSLHFSNKNKIVRKKHPIEQQVKEELAAYFADPTHQFSIKLELSGTDYQQKVWRALTKIPSGKVLTYGELASKIASGPRAIGQACRLNPIAIIIPCHRIVSASGTGGYAGSVTGKLLAIKHGLLNHEHAGFF